MANQFEYSVEIDGYEPILTKQGTIQWQDKAPQSVELTWPRALYDEVSNHGCEEGFSCKVNMVARSGGLLFGMLDSIRCRAVAAEDQGGGVCVVRLLPETPANQPPGE